MNSKQTVQMILAGAAIALVLPPVSAQRSAGRRVVVSNNSAMFNYGIGYNYGLSGSNLMSGASIPLSGGFTVTHTNNSPAINSNGVIIGSGGARITRGTGNGVVVSGSNYYTGYPYPGTYGYPSGYFYGDPSAYVYNNPGYGYDYNAIGPVGSYDGNNAAANGQGIDTVGAPPAGAFVPGANSQAPNNGIPMAQTVSGALQMTREGNGRVRLTWNGDTSLVRHIYLALLNRNKQAILQKELTAPPASARFVRDPRAKYAGVIVDFVDGTRSTTINPLQ